ncbi:YjdJ family protein [Metabacillus sp. HB246100]
MKVNMIVQFGIGILSLLFATVMAWYEGSNIIQNPSEWRYSALFTRMIDGPVQNGREILQIDYFIYAAKYYPFFPIMMIISTVYLALLIGYQLCKGNKRRFRFFLLLFGCLVILFSGVMTSSPTSGIKLISRILLILSTVMLIYPLGRWMIRRLYLVGGKEF